MYSVFSNHLVKRMSMRLHVPMEDLDLRSCLEVFQQDSNPIDPYLFLPNVEDYENDAKDESYYLSVKPKLTAIVYWASREILAKILVDSYKTRDVKIRILAGMLNKLEDEGIIPRYLSMFYHDVFVKNIHELTMDLMKEELPFLLIRGCYPCR